MRQISYFGQDLRRMTGGQYTKLIFLCIGRAFWGIWLYRFERSLYLWIGKPYGVVRILFLPVLNLIQAYSNIDIHYKADIKGGISILHPSPGIVISGRAIIGKNLMLTGGNVIGIRLNCPPGGLVIGDQAWIGANAVILGPVRLGNNINVGASACVLKDCEIDNSVLVGVPAKRVETID